MPPPYKDAVAGTFLAGEALAGTWWAYPPQAGLGLAGIPPDLEILEGQVPQAKLYLAAPRPEIQVDSTVTVPQAGLGLQTYPFTLAISQAPAVPQAGLWLLAVLPDYAGVLWLYPVTCESVALGSPPIINLSLEPVACTEVELEPMEVK